MAKRIIFIEPIGAFQGALGAKQTLLYDENNNAAFYSPEGKRNSARNYRSNYISMYDKRSGRARFAVRTRYTFNATEDAIVAMAVMGGTAATYSAFLKTYGIGNAKTLYQDFIDSGRIEPTTTMRQFFCGYFSRIIRDGDVQVELRKSTGALVILQNPYMNPETTYQLKTKTFLKFFDILCLYNVNFTIDNQRGVSFNNITWGALINSKWNVLGLTTKAYLGNTYIQMNGYYVQNQSKAYLTTNMRPVNGNQYTLTLVSPL